jgi:hypothetical protein
MQGSSAGPKESQAPVPANVSQDGDLAETEEAVSLKPEVVSLRSRSDAPFVTDPQDIEPHRQKVTLRLIWILLGLIVINYVFMFVLDWQGKKLENVSNAYNDTLPVISGLVGSAVTYYFARRSDK